MALINHRAREIHFKIVYVGPGAGGKTTNLRVLHDRLPLERRGKLLSISTDHERTLFFDFLPIDLGQVNGFATRFHLYTVPGQVYYRLSRRAVLQGLDGVVFVADSHPSRESANLDALADTFEHLKAIGMTPAQVMRIPWVFQFNKRDLPGALPVARLHGALNREGAPEFEATAVQGAGVTETLRAACKAVLARLGAQPTAPASGTVTVPAAPVARMPQPPAAQPLAAAAATATATAPAPPRTTATVPVRPAVPRPVLTPAPLARPAVAPAPRPAAPAPAASVPVAPRPAVPAPAPTPPRPAATPWPMMPPASAPRSSTSVPRPVITQVPGAPPRITPPPLPRKADAS
jgi:mutual gliding-motility protein MglA